MVWSELHPALAQCRCTLAVRGFVIVFPTAWAIPLICAHSRAVASNRQTEVLASIISFVFYVYSHHEHPKDTQEDNLTTDITSVIIFHWHCRSHIFFVWLRPCIGCSKLISPQFSCFERIISTWNVNKREHLRKLKLPSLTHTRKLKTSRDWLWKVSN